MLCAGKLGWLWLLSPSLQSSTPPHKTHRQSQSYHCSLKIFLRSQISVGQDLVRVTSTIHWQRSLNWLTSDDSLVAKMIIHREKLSDTRQHVIQAGDTHAVSWRAPGGFMEEGNILSQFNGPHPCLQRPIFPSQTSLQRSIHLDTCPQGVWTEHVQACTHRPPTQGGSLNQTTESYTRSIAIPPHASVPPSPVSWKHPGPFLFVSVPWPSLHSSHHHFFPDHVNCPV